MSLMEFELHDPIMRGVASTLAKHVNVWEGTAQRLTQRILQWVNVSKEIIKMNFKPGFSHSALHEMFGVFCFFQLQH